MPTLEWLGKEKVTNHHLDVPYRVLERKYSFDQNGKSEKDNGSENKIIRGDNLEALKALLPQYERKIKCIYIDPPYNTGNENWIYNDNVNDPKIKKWLGQVVGREGEDLSRHDKWLCMMYPRLKLLHKLLADDGVFLVSIGDDELANLLLVIKEIFGNINCIFVWKSRSKPTNAGPAKYRPQKVTEYVVMFTKDDKKLFNIGSKEDTYSYPYSDKDGNYRTTTILTSNNGTYQRETMRFEIAGYIPPKEQRWKAGKDKIQELYDTNRLIFTEDGTPMEKVYDYDNDGISTPLYTLIDSNISGTAESGKTLLNKIIGSGHGFDTVKPIGLLSYLISVCSNEEDIILDSFAGTGTTAHAVLSLNKERGNRKFILVEMEDYAENITAERIKHVINGYADVEGTGGDFSFYDLGEPLMIADKINEKVDIDRIREYIWFTETKSPVQSECKNENMHYLGKFNSTAYYFYYEKEKITTLDFDFLVTIPEKEAHYLIYADKCALSPEELIKYNITFKKIPRDIAKL